MRRGISQLYIKSIAVKTIKQDPSDPNAKNIDKTYISDPGNTSYNSVAKKEEEKEDLSKDESADVDDNAGLNTDGESAPWGTESELY